jgi:hypothetical protein
MLTKRLQCHAVPSQDAQVRAGPHVQGARTAERLPREAMLELGVTLGTAVSEAPAQATEVFASIEHAREGVTALAGAAARAAAGGYASTMRLQAMMGEVRVCTAARWPNCILLLSSLRHQAHGD